MAKYYSTFKSTFKTFLESLTITVAGKNIANVFYGNLEGAKDAKKMPLIEYDLTLEDSDAMTTASENMTISINVRLWGAMNKNGTNIDELHDGLEEIASEFKKSTSFRALGVIQTSITTKIDPDPLVKLGALGQSITISCIGSSSNERT